MREITVPADQVSDEIQIIKPKSDENPDPKPEAFKLRFADFVRDVLALDWWDAGNDVSRIQAALGLKHNCLRLAKSAEVGTPLRVTDVQHEKFSAAMQELKIENPEVKAMVRSFRLAWIQASSVQEDPEAKPSAPAP